MTQNTATNNSSSGGANSTSPISNEINKFWNGGSGQQNTYLRPVINFNAGIIGTITFNDNDSAEDQDEIKNNLEKQMVEILSEANNSVGSR